MSSLSPTSVSMDGKLEGYQVDMDNQRTSDVSEP